MGFPVNFTVVAQDPNVEQRVGFSAFGLPEYARVTTVQGTNPVQITTFWTPCEGQHAEARRHQRERLRTSRQMQS